MWLVLVQIIPSFKLSLVYNGIDTQLELIYSITKSLLAPNSYHSGANNEKNILLMNYLLYYILFYRWKMNRHQKTLGLRRPPHASELFMMFSILQKNMNHRQPRQLALMKPWHGSFAKISYRFILLIRKDLGKIIYSAVHISFQRFRIVY
jgi:hypothetical protein